MDQNTLINIPNQIKEAVSEIAQAREEIIELLTIGLLAGGHVLLEGHAGTAKTLVARSFAESIGGTFRRVQLTPDMLPSDVTGFELYRPDGNSRFVEGPLFANVVLADELNRTTPRTQSAFLEAMQERQATIEGTTYPLPEPLFVIATQVPLGGDGTYPITDVQADRFMLRLWSDYPTRTAELLVLANADQLEDPHVDAVTTPNDILSLRELVKQVHMAESIRGYILDIVTTLRENESVQGGPSTRASLALYRGSRASAFLQNRDFVIPDDVRKLAPNVLEHRVRPTTEAEFDQITAQDLIQNALETIPIPKGDDE